MNEGNLILIVGIALLLIYIIKLKKDNLKLKKQELAFLEEKCKLEEYLFSSLEYGNKLEDIIKGLSYDFRKISLFIARKDESFDNDILKLEELLHNAFLIFSYESISNKDYKLKLISLIEKAIYQLLRNYETERNDCFINSVIVETKINNHWLHDYQKFTGNEFLRIDDFYAFESLSHSLENTKKMES